jgi:5'-methylthioadenosine phosphorylase
MVKIGIIGGTGLENPELLKEVQEKEVETQFGKPSSALMCGKINEIDVVIISRHGKGHTIMPSKVNNRANILALKEEGCTHILAATACGSLKEEIKPGDLVFIDQFIDRTTKRHQSFYGDNQFKPNAVCHIPMANPFCEKLIEVFSETASELNLSFHKKGTMVTIEGPRFSTRAESYMFRSWNADVINMSTVPEVVLAREAGLCYASVAMSTDYDCWKEDEVVNIGKVMETMKVNAINVTNLFLAAIPKIKDEPCSCREMIKTSVMGEK